MEELPDAQSITAMSIGLSIFTILILGFMFFGMFCKIKSAFETGKITVDTHPNEYGRKTEPFTFWFLVYSYGVLGFIALLSIVTVLLDKIAPQFRSEFRTLLKGIAERLF